MKHNQPLHCLHIAALCMSIPALVSTAFASDAALYLDGRLRVVGAPVEGARVVVYLDARPSQVITADISHFELRLELQRSYLLSFEREGCITKQLRFDTHVPAADLANAPFTFPFKVTLQRSDDGSTLRYAGPVGFIRYFEEGGDFGYDRDYAMLRDPVDADAPGPLPLPLLVLDPPNPVTFVPLQLAEAGPDASASTGNTAGAVRPARRMVEAFVDPTLALGDLVGAIALDPRPIVITLPRTGSGRRMVAPFVDPSASAGLISFPEKRSILPKPKPAPTLLHPSTGAERRSIVPRMRLPQVASAPTICYPEGRMEEVIKERLRVTRVVRLTSHGHTTEYRRVSHRYGPVYYFKNGISCGGSTYEAGINGR